MKKQVHLIAVGGAVMHNLALALDQKGYSVTGSDDHIFDPSKSRLQMAGLLPEEGWNPSRIHPSLSAIILGMHARKDNPELLQAEKLGLPVWSFPEFIYRESVNKLRTAICGSHGKTTITAMVMFILKAANRDFDYLVGAQLRGFDIMVRLSEAPLIILEGDEYLASPLDRRPKFVHYKPQVALLSGIAWDHINVFPTYDSYLDAFRSLAAAQQKDDFFIYNAEDRETDQILPDAAGTKVPYRCPDYKIREGLIVCNPEGDEEFTLKVIGRHNLLNAAGAVEVCKVLGVPAKEAWKAISEFPGAARRLEVIGQGKDSIVIRDFAHSPSKVRASTEAVAEQFGNKGLTACLELHTFSSLDSRFLPQYQQSLDAAERAILYFNPETVKAKKLDPISPDQIKKAFGRDDLEVICDSEELHNALFQKDVSTLLLMSSGPIGGIDLNELANFITSP